MPLSENYPDLILSVTPIDLQFAKNFKSCDTESAICNEKSVSDSLIWKSVKPCKHYCLVIKKKKTC